MPTTSGGPESPASPPKLGIKVVCRILDKEERDGYASPTNGLEAENTIQVVDSQTVRLPVITVKGKATSDAITKKNFVVHEVMQSRLMTTGQLYQSLLGASFVQGILDHSPVAIISYGAEKTGKSWTLFGQSQHVSTCDGEASETGLVSCLLRDLFSAVQCQSAAVPSWVQVGMMLVLKNDTLHDLLCEKKEQSPEFAVRAATEADALHGPWQPAEGITATSPFHIGGGMVVAGLSSLISRDHQAVCDAINLGLSAPRDLKGDKVLLLNVITCNADPASSSNPGVTFTSITIVDCSPVYSKSMHNLRDIANSVANKHRNAEFMKSNLTRLLKNAFCGDCALRLIVHCKVSSFDLDLFDSLSSLNFSSLVMKIHRNVSDPESSSDVSKSMHQNRKIMRDAASSPLVPTGRPAGPFSASSILQSSSAHTATPADSKSPGPVGSDAATSSSTMDHTSSPEAHSTKSPKVSSFLCTTPPPKLNLECIDSPRVAVQPLLPTKSPGRSPQMFSPTVRSHPFSGEDGPVSMEINSLQHAQITSLLHQLREKDESYRKALGSNEQMALLLQQEQEKSRRLEQQNEALAKNLRQLEAQGNASHHHHVKEGDGVHQEIHPARGGPTDDVATFVDCTDEDEQYALSQGLPTGSSAHAIFSQPSVAASPPKNAAFPSNARGSPSFHPPSQQTGQPGATSPNAAPNITQAHGTPQGPVQETSDAATSPIFLVSPTPPAPEPLATEPTSVVSKAAENPESTTAVTPTHQEVETEDHDSNSSGSGSDEDTALPLEVEEIGSFGGSVCSSDDVLTDNERRSSNAKLLNRVTQLKDKVKRYKQLTKSYTAQLNHQTYLANHYSMQLEEEQKKSQEHIQKTIALSTRLDETKKWVRKLKKAVLAEKEKALPMYNEALSNRIEMRKLEERRQEEFKRQCDTFIEQQNALNHELQLKCEKVEAMEMTVQALSNEYNQRLLEMVSKDEAWHVLLSNLSPLNGSPGQSSWPQTMLQFNKDNAQSHDPQTCNATDLVNALHMQLRLENEVLRSNIQGVMQVVDHCYEENIRLSNLTARLTRSLAEANEWQQHRMGNAMPPGEDGRRLRWKEDKYLKQIANLHFTVVRLKKQLQEVGVESHADAAMSEEEEDETFSDMDEVHSPVEVEGLSDHVASVSSLDPTYLPGDP